MTLWTTLEVAVVARNWLDDTRCGGGCRGDHQIIPMTLDEARRSAARWAWWDGPKTLMDGQYAPPDGMAGA